MAEWLKAHAWKACIPQGIQGSNPCLSAIIQDKPPVPGDFSFSLSRRAETNSSQLHAVMSILTLFYPTSHP